MGHMLEELSERSERSIEDMKAAARRARTDHAASELVRHMLTTTRKSANAPRHEAIEAVVGEWLEAWHLDRHEWPDIALEMEMLTGAFYDYCNDPSDSHDEAVRAAWLRLKKAHDNDERTLEDQMAWRSVCAHGWWGDVEPAPAGYRDHDASRARDPFWTKACPPQCL